MFTVNPKNFDPVISLFADMLRQNMSTAYAGNQKQQAIAEGRNLGIMEGRVDGITAILTARRCIRYPDNEPFLPMVEDHLVARLWKQMAERNEKEKEELKNDKERGKKSRLEVEFWKWVHEEIEKITYPPDLEEERFKRHKKAVLAGEIEPTDEDKRGWLAKELDRRRADAEKIESLLK
jgi:hypothetical protein